MAGSVDVLVVGAGPTGLMVAGELARHGVDVRVIDKRDEPSDKSKALAVHARTLEIFDDLGIASAAVERGLRSHGMNIYAGGQRIVSFTMDELDSPYPFILILPQYETEALLATRCGELGVEIERGRELESLSQDADGVTAVVSGDELRCRWLIGCDGAHSTVRREIGVEFAGGDVPARFAFADVVPDWSLAADEGHTYFAEDGVLLCLPLPGGRHWRLIVDISGMEDVPAEPPLELFQEIVERRAGLPVTLRDPVWRTSFEIRQRKVDHYRDGRVFLAGDAAHAHSPVGGQGMNTGLQDAYNLAWKLALVDKGSGRSVLLDSYGAEREPIARDLLAGTELATRVVTLRNPVSRAIRNRLASFLSGFEVVRQRIARNVGELAIGYRGSPIVGEDRDSALGAHITHSPDSEVASLRDWRDFGAAPRPGDRAPDADLSGDRRLFDLLAGGRHVLLLFDGASATEAGYANLAEIAARVSQRFDGYVDCHLIVPAAEAPQALASFAGSVILDPDGRAHFTYGAGAECAYLIRPDGYIGYRCQPAKADWITDYLARIFV